MSLRALIINPADNVANLIGPGGKGESVECTIEGKSETSTITLLDDIPSNHKFAPVDIKAGEPITKYGLCIGKPRAISRPGSMFTCTTSSRTAVVGICRSDSGDVRSQAGAWERGDFRVAPGRRDPR